MERLDSLIFNSNLANPSVTNPSVTNPSVTNPSITNSSITNPPATNFSVTNPPVRNLKRPEAIRTKSSVNYSPSSYKDSKHNFKKPLVSKAPSNKKYEHFTLQKTTSSKNWIKALEIIKLELGSDLYSSYFNSIKYLDSNISNQNLSLKISVPNIENKKKIFTKYKSLLLKAVKKGFSCKKVEIAFRIETRIQNRTENGKRKTFFHPNLNPNYNFSNFIVGKCNQLAYNSCLNSSKNLGSLYNPLFIYGDSGLGKTHLANAVGNECIKSNKKALYVSSERFVSELVLSIRTKKMDNFKSKFRNLDLLIIDDIQFIIGKQRTQEEFFHTFNELFEKQKQIIITSDKAPQHFENLEPRLRSRFSSGLSIDLQSPDIETVIKVIQTKSAKIGLDLSEQAITLISNRVNNNFRELEGAINRISAISKKPELEEIREVLNNLYPRKIKTVNASLIMDLVCQKYNVEIKDLTGKRRTKNIAAARQVGMFLCRDVTGLSYPEIGKTFGGRDHSTAIHAFKSVQKKALANSNYSEDLESLKRALKQ